MTALWGLSESRVRHELNVALFLERYFPGVWELCHHGQLDGYRASIIADHARHTLDDPVCWATSPPACRPSSNATSPRPTASTASRRW